MSAGNRWQANGIDDAKAEWSGQRIFACFRDIADLVGFAQNVFGLRDNLPPDFGYPYVRRAGASKSVIPS